MLRIYPIQDIFNFINIETGKAIIALKMPFNCWRLNHDLLPLLVARLFEWK